MTITPVTTPTPVNMSLVYHVTLLISYREGTLEERGARRPHGGNTSAYISRNPSGKSCQFEWTGRRRNPKKRGSSPPQRVKPVYSNNDGVSFRTISRGRVSVLHRIIHFSYHLLQLAHQR
ncbi:hypothetical protein EVAR_61621_1 [Eumeta japonica]|uniref:Uncharacterized protein n=1 Tax=Eumeta variegata TaxID=151549 RepID=A0A4C1ZMM9_EUMVA|nr:hypothetical protein EVAR_61621_1 [Eumeta japonica]